MTKMDNDTLLSNLQALEDEGTQYVWGDLADSREEAMREYYRQPYGNEEEGLSSIVTSEVQDTVEWMLPDLLDIFTSTDKAVVFEPTRAQDVQGAAQATDAVNYVFNKQNPGFLNLYTSFKDALLSKNCAVMVRKETRRTKTVTPARGASQEMLAMLLMEAGENAEIENATPLAPQVDPTTGLPGPQLYNARICGYKDKQTIKVEAFPPEQLIVKRDWVSPLLNDCPYVARMMPVTLSDIHEMGYPDVEAEDLKDATDLDFSSDASFRRSRNGDLNSGVRDENTINDDSRAEGLLRIEYVLVDYDGDGISERRKIYRLRSKILLNEECDAVPIVTASPILVPHRWDGMSLAEAMSDLQKLKTELTRQMVDSGRLANNPRTEVLTDTNGSPYANIDDLLDSRAGGIIRKTRPDSLTTNVMPWVGGQMFPLLEYVDSMGEKRTGISRVQQGIDPNILKTNRTMFEAKQTMQSAKQRIKLVARIFGEILLKPIFSIILKELTEGGMDKIAFRLRGEFVELDPNEWHDQYDMTVNVGLGTGDSEQQLGMLQAVAQSQAMAAQSLLGPMLVTPKNIYNTQAKMIEAAGFKNVGDFWQDPGDGPMPKPEAPQDPKLQIEQMKLQADAQKFQAQSMLDKELESVKAQAKLQEVQATLELQAANDARDSEREILLANHKAELEAARLELDRYKVDADNRARITVAQISHANDGADIDEDGNLVEKPDKFEPIMQTLQAMMEQSSAPKEVVRDESGAVIGVRQGGVVKSVTRDESGRVVGLQ